MSLISDGSKLARSDDFQQTFENIKRLSDHLPEEAVVSLAREVILRLAENLDAKPASVAVPNPESIAALADALIGPDPHAAAVIMDERAAEGADLRDLYLGWLGPAALQLGKWWDEDKITFVNVTIGTGRIYAIMRRLRRSIKPPRFPVEKVTLFALVPGEDHSLGIKMAADLFRKDGWSVDLQVSLDHDALVNHIAASRQVLIGLSAAGEHALPGLAKLLLAIRVCAPEAMVLISGNIVNDCAEQIALMDFDAVCSDFGEAKSWADALWTNHPGRTIQS
jgi:methanogenic corrinoid protein MtbC1